MNGNESDGRRPEGSRRLVRATARGVIAAALLAAICCAAPRTAAKRPPAASAAAEPGHLRMAARVREEFLFAWRSYDENARGHDEWRPVSRTVRDWYPGASLLMTPVDSLDTMILMGLADEAARTRALIVENLSFDKDISHLPHARHQSKT